MPNRDEVVQRLNQKLEIARARLGNPQRFSYGPTEIEALDVYATEAVNSPLHVYIPGGTWRFNEAARAIYLAEMNVDAGVTFVALDFTRTPNDLAVTRAVYMCLAILRAGIWPGSL